MRTGRWYNWFSGNFDIFGFILSSTVFTTKITTARGFCISRDDDNFSSSASDNLSDLTWFFKHWQRKMSKYHLWNETKIIKMSDSKDQYQRSKINCPLLMHASVQIKWINKCSLSLPVEWLIFTLFYYIFYIVAVRAMLIYGWQIIILLTFYTSLLPIWRFLCNQFIIFETYTN